MTIKIAQAKLAEHRVKADIRPPLITLICDASWCPTTNAGGWAIWWKSSAKSGKASGFFNTPFAKSYIAEAAAIVNGLHRADAQGAQVLVQTDCLSAISLLRDKPKPASGADALMVWERFCSVSTHTGARVTFRHIKAHSGTDTPRTWVHDMLDQEARFQMRLRRHELKGAA
ncbi:ribonuclease H family protein [Roseococcus pinisoli]|uniref:Reverse transcriptase-like protein n=1 Tax=Roseococcus pinisoli TaxID=2835040 RepID=A0ABS5QF20_9PROT|nr:reverse transcriptase-like protein [Roseococcus pinisoli]MBS7812295.1 reverse transcriptase-like protein [Roseococcus pinisoli]